MKKYMMLALVLVFFSITIIGCGETINGVSKDAKRISKGIKTVFMREGRQ